MRATKLMPFAALAAAFAVAVVPSAPAGEISGIPSPDYQGGMIMPMVSIINADNNNDPTSGTIAIGFNPATPELKSLQDFSGGSWFADTAAWRGPLGSPQGVGGTPAANAGSGGRFNSQYGFSFMAMPPMGRANIPTGKSLAIRLTDLSSPDLQAFNYVENQNRFDEVFGGGVGSQVLWNGSMWHTVFAIPADAPGGSYTAEFEVFIADTAFSGSTGWAQYDAAALAASADPDFTPASVTYTWQAAAVPEPASVGLLAAAVLAVPLLRRWRA
jgi:hypothetical protein